MRCKGIADVNRRDVILGALCVLGTPRASSAAQRDASPPGAVVFYASQSGKPTYDAAEGGGNPFASAFIELIEQDVAQFDDFARRLAELTKAKSGDRQIVERRGSASADVSPAASRWRTGSRVALVIVNSDYADSQGAQSLPGARHDADRVANALSRAGFATRTVIDARLADFKAALAEFERRSRKADVAVIYTTGHGVEVGGAVHLLMGNFPVPKGAAALPTHAVKLAAIAEAAKARRANFVFYGGCRDNPFAK